MKSFGVATHIQTQILNYVHPSPEHTQSPYSDESTVWHIIVVMRVCSQCRVCACCVHSLGLDKSTRTCVYHFGSKQRIFTPKIPCAPSIINPFSSDPQQPLIFLPPQLCSSRSVIPSQACGHRLSDWLLSPENASTLPPSLFMALNVLFILVLSNSSLSGLLQILFSF